MKTTTRGSSFALIAVLVLLGAGCATMPKPAELDLLEKLRAEGPPEGMKKAERALLARSDAAYKQAVEAWRDNEEVLARHFAHVGRLTLRQARTRAAKNRGRTEIARLEREIALAKEQRKSVNGQLARTEELIALHEELAVARINTREKAMHLSEVQQAATTRHHISEASLALKMAETVEAPQHARKLYLMAKSMISRATKKLAAKKIKAAAATAEIAKQRAEAAYAKARPLYLRDKAVASRRARNLSLQRDLASVAAKHRGVSVRLLPAEQGAKLEVRVTFLFGSTKSNPHPKKREILLQLGGVLKKYPEYPVMITGYTSHRTPRKKRPALSLARAEVVREIMIKEGLSARRFVANGEGALKLIGYKFNGINDRVELLVPLSAEHPTSRPATKKAPMMETL